MAYLCTFMWHVQMCMCMCMCNVHVACARRSVHAPCVVGRGQWAVGMCGAVHRRAQCICGDADGLLVAAQEALGAVDRVEHPRAPRRRPALCSATQPQVERGAPGARMHTCTRTHMHVHAHAYIWHAHCTCRAHAVHMACTCRPVPGGALRTLPPPSPSPRLRKAPSRRRPLRRRRPSSARLRRPQQRASRRPRRAGAPTSPPQ